MAGIFNSSIFNNAIFNTGAVAPPPGGGASGARYRVHTDWDKQRASRKKLEARIEKIERRIEKQQKQISVRRETADPQEIAGLISKLRQMQQLLLQLLAQLDMMKKLNDDAEELEVIAVYLAYRSLH